MVMKNQGITTITVFAAFIGWIAQWVVLSLTEQFNGESGIFISPYDLVFIIIGVTLFCGVSIIFHANDESVIIRQGTHTKILIVRATIAALNSLMLGLYSDIGFATYFVYHAAIFGVMFDPLIASLKGQNFLYRGTEAGTDQIFKKRGLLYYLIKVVIYVASIWLIYFDYYN